MKSRPLADRVIVKPDEQKKPEGDLYLPEEKLPVGEAVAIGRKVEEVKVGDKVMYGKFSGIEVTLDGIEYLVMHEKEIILFP